jgi:hypothetical protein
MFNSMFISNKFSFTIDDTVLMDRLLLKKDGVHNLLYFMQIINTKFKMDSCCFVIMGGHGNFAFNLVVKLSVELGYVFLSFRL